LLNVIIKGPRSIVEAAIDIQRRNLDRA
jgi:hypothetical protein